MELKLCNLQNKKYFISNNIKYVGIYISEDITCYHNDIGRDIGYFRGCVYKKFKL